MKHLAIIGLLFVHVQASSQLYTSFFTGNSTDLTSSPQGGVCMMGGASEHNQAMKWFLERADGGDILVLRASGSDGYNDYLYSDLGIPVNSVETIVFNNPNASNEIYIHEKIMNAEAIWFAGGNQWDYVSFWRDTPIDSLINDAILNRNIVVGGTSAGMAILGKYYFSANYGTVTSSTALSDPYNYRVTVDSTSFLHVNYLEDVVTDTHYDDPDRKGRHVVFLARILTDYGVEAKGIACNEYTSVCIDQNGLASVYGDYPNYPETAYFLQTNCEIPDFTPENCSPSNSLDWNLNTSAIRVYKVNGTNNGANNFNLSDWETGNGGTWENWYVDNGTLLQIDGSQIDCSEVSVSDHNLSAHVKIHPNPFMDVVYIESENEITELTIVDLNGQLIMFQSDLNSTEVSIDTKLIPTGIYFIKLVTHKGLSQYKLLKN